MRPFSSCLHSLARGSDPPLVHLIHDASLLWEGASCVQWYVLGVQLRLCRDPNGLEKQAESSTASQSPAPWKHLVGTAKLASSPVVFKPAPPSQSETRQPILNARENKGTQGSP